MSILFIENKIENKHLMFRLYIDNNESQLSLIDNKSESEFLNESFVHKWNIEIFELAHEDRVKLILEDDTLSQTLTHEIHVNLQIREHREKLFCYVVKLECDLILENNWLQTHNSHIDWNTELWLLLEIVRRKLASRTSRSESRRSRIVQSSIFRRSLSSRSIWTFNRFRRNDFESWSTDRTVKWSVFIRRRNSIENSIDIKRKF